MIGRHFAALFLFAGFALSACGASAAGGPGPHVLATTTVVGDIAQNVAGGRLTVETLLPRGADPHEYQLTPQDTTKIAESTLLIANGVNYEAWLQETLQNAGGQRTVVIATDGLTKRTSAEGEDPHMWMDPNNVIQYVENIRAALTQADPGGAAEYQANAAAYTANLRELDTWIFGQVDQIPAGNRLLVTNHDSLGYFVDRYGFKVIGTIVPGLSSEASPSARQMAELIDMIKATGAPAVFLNVSDNPHLADQVREETDIAVVDDLYIESLSPLDGPAATYLDMMRYNVTRIVEALK